MIKGNAVVGQSGGPTAVINASLIGVVQTSKYSQHIENIFGMRFGIEGFMQENLIDLGKESDDILEGVKLRPGSVLGSSRHKLQDDDLPRILEVLKRYSIRYFFLVGGNDTMDTIYRVVKYSREKGYELVGIGIPKTVDNDLFGTDHTPGFPSAGRYIALSIMHAGILARDMQKVDQFVIFQAIGRDAGWLTASAVMGKRTEEDPPHILCLPERPFDRKKFLQDVKRCYDKFGWVSIVCGEGIKYEDGTPVSASQIKDKFGNIEYGAMGGTSVAIVLHRMISEEFGFRGEFQITESLPMSAADRVVELDREEAYICGKRAVELSAEGISGVMVTIVRESDEPYKSTTGTVLLEEVAAKAKPMPDDFINEEGNFITDEFIKYAKPLIGELPEYKTLSALGKK